MTELICPYCKVECEPCGEYDSFWPMDRRCPKCRSVFDGDTGDFKFIEPKNGVVRG